MSGTQSQGGAINIAQLLSSLAPIFLGTGATTQTQSGTSSSTTGTSSSSINPATLASLTGIASTATNNANNPAMTDNIVSNILKESAQAFAPVIAQSASAGLYNSASLAALSSEAQARATAAASQGVLNYQTSQEQVASQALGTIANDTKTTTTSQQTQQSPVTNVKVTAPTVSPLTSIATLGGGVIGNKLLGSQTVSDALGSVGSSLGDTGSNIINAGANLIGAAPVFPVGTLPSTAILPTAASDSAIAGGSGLADAGVSVGSNAVDLSLADTAGATFGSVGADTAGGIAGSAAGAGLDAAGIAAGGIADTGIAAAGADAATSFLGAASSDAAIAGGAGAAGIAGATDAGIIGTGAADAGAAAAGGLGIGDILSSIGEAIAAVVAWIICTELLRQGKMSPTLYRYGYVFFQKYPNFIKQSYLIWAKPVTRHIKKYPDGFLCKIAERVFNKRVNNLAANAGCKVGVWTVEGAVINGLLYIGTCAVGVGILLPILGVRALFSSSKKKEQVV